MMQLEAVRARMPGSYEAAVIALAECSRIDECQNWANKAEALASYAKQADDDSLRKLADRIQARAVRRAGELLREFDGRGRPPEIKDGTDLILFPSQRQAAASAGMSERQQKTAVRVSKIPPQVFEAAVESPTPPTVTKLAGMSRAPRPHFKKATDLLGAMGRMAEFCAANDPQDVVQGLMPSEADALAEKIMGVGDWLDWFVECHDAQKRRESFREQFGTADDDDECGDVEVVYVSPEHAEAERIKRACIVTEGKVWAKFEAASSDNRMFMLAWLGQMKLTLTNFDKNNPASTEAGS
jgi:hypothetical protein